ncbi:multidrug ABC transporter substrate-binding protein [Candidatus Magnetoovum chiemensis]|nr:multidrug ABC transporter substrate-binding protein [Candidatus Magnetoovum chiemensis]
MKRLIGIFKTSLHAALAYKLRSVFCLLSVSLGIASITLIAASVEGAYQKAFDLIEKFGPDSVLIFGGSPKQRAVGNRDRTLTLDDVKAIEQAITSAYLVVPMLSARDTNISYSMNKYQTNVIGSTENYSEGWSWTLEEGRAISKDDVERSENVCVLGLYVKEQLFGSKSPIGNYIRVRSLPCRIIGVLSERGASPMGANQDDRVVMPITTVMKKVLNEPKYVSAIRVRYKDAEHIKIWVNQLNDFLRIRHNIKEGEDEDFKVVSSDEIIQFLVALTGSLVLFLGIDGLVTLIVSGFVLANLFLLSVSERKNEIGIRRACGARKADIFTQFIMESSIITSAGGVLGFLFGFGASKLIVLIGDFPLHFSWRAFVLGIALSLIIGVVFAVHPAQKAANLNPIEAVK